MQTSTTRKELKMLIEEYSTIPEYADDELLNLYGRIARNLEQYEKIILYLYAEETSERKTSEKLGISRSTLRKILTQIRQKLGITETNKAENENDN